MSTMEVTELKTQVLSTILMKILKLAVAPLEFQKKEWGIYIQQLAWWEEAARLDDIVSLLYENMHGMQKMFTDTVTLALIEEDKTKQIIQQEWSKKGPKSFKSLNY